MIRDPESSTFAPCQCQKNPWERPAPYRAGGLASQDRETSSNG